MGALAVSAAPHSKDGQPFDGGVNPLKLGSLNAGGPILCAVGGVLGGIGVGWVGREAGKAGGEAVYDFVTTFRWE
jgi:hypothetical protein